MPALAINLLAPAAQENKSKPELPPEIQAIVGLAMATPPEFAADGLLRVVASGKVPDRQNQRELIELAFRLAGRAQHPMALVAIPGTAADTRAGFLGSALRLGLDAITLQSRAVEAMLRLDPPYARELLAQINKPNIETLQCDDRLAPSIGPYYEVAGRIAREAFGPVERQRQEHVAFVVSVIGRVSSSAELPDAAMLISTIEWTPSQYEVVLGGLISKLDSLPPDNRAFTFMARALEDSMGPVVARSKQYGLNPQAVLQAYRKYLVSQLTGPRCRDGSGPGMFVVQGNGQPELFAEPLRGDLPALTADEMKPEKFNEGAKAEEYWQSGKAKQVFEECLRLRMGADGREFNEASRNTREWKRQLSDFLVSLGSWKPSEEASEADYFHENAIVYEALLELTPAGGMRDRVMQSYIAFLAASSLQQQSPVEWYWHVHSTLNRLRPAQPQEAARLLAMLAESGGPILSLRAALDRVAPDYSMFPR